MTLSSILPSGSKQRAAAAVALVLLLTVAYTQLALPGSSGPSRGTPMAILFGGVVLGLVNSLTAVALVLIYRTLRIVNFAQTAIGVIAAVAVYDAIQFGDFPFAVAFPLGLLLCAITGVIFDVILRRFSSSPRLVLTVFTIAAAAALAQGGPSLVRTLPWVQQASIAAATGTDNVRDLLPFAGWNFTVGGLATPNGFPEVFALEVVALGLAGVAAFFKLTKSGIAVRALSENTERASMLGISIGSVTMVAWVLASVLSGANAVLIGALESPAVARGFAPSVLLPALAAATVGRFQRFPVTIATAVVIQVVAEATEFSAADYMPLLNPALLVLIAAALILQRRKGGRTEQGGGVSWQASEEPRPIPKELAKIGTVRVARWVLIVLGLIVVVVYPFTVSTGSVVLGSGIALSAILTLSIVVLTGWAGQVSLGQYGFYAIGAVLGGALTAKVGIPFWFAVPIAAVLTGVFAGLVGIPALRLRGLFLAVTTFAFAIAVASVLFRERFFGFILPTEVERPTLFLLDFDDERSMYFLCVVALVLAVVVVTNLRRSRFGRVLIASRENEANIQAFGINLVRTKLLAFVVSGVLCGFAGAIFAHLLRGVNGDAFAAQNSVDLFVFAVLGGVSSAGGALLGSALLNIQGYFLTENVVFQALGPFLAMVALYFIPGGLIGAINAARDSALRIVAQRRQIVVPSLFADYDPDALEKRLIPLGEASNLDGLAALPADERFSLRSELYQGSGQRFMEKLQPSKESKEAAAIGAASQAAQEANLPVPAGVEE